MENANQLVFYCFAGGKTWGENESQVLKLDGGDLGMVTLLAPQSTDVHRLYCKCVKVTIEEITEDELRQAQADGLRANLDEHRTEKFISTGDAYKWFTNLLNSGSCNAYRIMNLYNHTYLTGAWIGYRTETYSVNDADDLLRDFAIELDDQRNRRFVVCAIKLDTLKNVNAEIRHNPHMVEIAYIHKQKKS